MAAYEPTPPAGPGVDARGVPVDDPTENVMQLVEASVKRLDDLRGSESTRLDQLRILETAHVKEMMILRDAATTERQRFNEELRKAETARIDAIRAVDVGAVGRAAEVAAAQAITLANQVSVSAETLRTQVQASAAAAAAALGNALEPIQKSIEDLRKTQYEQAGQKAQQSEYKTDTRDVKGNQQWMIGLIISIIFLVLALVGFAISLGAR